MIYFPGFKNIVEILLRHGAYVDAVELLHDYTPLHYAAELVSRFLYSNQIFISPQSFDCFQGFATIGTLLIELGRANINLRDKNHWTPLHLCLRPREY